MVGHARHATEANVDGSNCKSQVNSIERAVYVSDRSAGKVRLLHQTVAGQCRCKSVPCGHGSGMVFLGNAEDSEMTVTNTEHPVLVQSVMQRHPLTIHDYETVQDAVDKMTENHISALPVVDDGNYVKGILTISDLVRLVQDAERTLDSDLAIYDQGYVITDMIRETLGTDEVASVMSGNPITIHQDASLKEAARTMIEDRVHHLLVVGNDMKLFGMLSAIDFVRLAADEL